MIAPSGRVLAIDPGRVRFGLALSDPLGITAQGLESLESRGRQKDLLALAALARAHEAAQIVVGCPRNLDGSESDMTAFSHRLAADLQAATGLPVSLWDERLTSAEAERVLIDGDVRRERRARSRDRIAAVLILQGWLDWQAAQGPDR